MLKLVLTKPLKISLATMTLMIVAAIGWSFTRSDSTPPAATPPMPQQPAAPSTPAADAELAPEQFVEQFLAESSKQLPKQEGNNVIVKIERQNQTIRYTMVNEVDPLRPADPATAKMLQDNYLQSSCQQSSQLALLKLGFTVEMLFQYKAGNLTLRATPEDCGFNSHTAATPAASSAASNNDALVNTAASPSSSETPTSTSRELDTMNQNLPQKIGANSTLNRVEQVANTTRFLISNTQDAPSSALQAHHKATLLAESCSKLKRFLQPGMKLEYVTSYNDRSLVVSIFPEDCR